MKIAFVGASGYGNIGDDTYPILFRKYIENHDLVFLNSDINHNCLNDVDLLVMGGGGIIYCNETPHFQYMQWYMDKAITKKIPMCFISCGIQRFNGNTNFLQLWKPYFDYASCITVRTEYGQDLIKAVTNNKHVYYYPDLCYLFDTPQLVERNNNHVILIPAREMIASHEYYRDLIIGWTKEYNTNYSILNFGSPKDDKVTDKKIVEFIELLHEIDASFKVYPHISPEHNMNIIKSANGMLTGRYHGIVFGIKAGIARYSIHYIKEGFKFENEDIFQNIDYAKYHIDILEDIIKQVE